MLYGCRFHVFENEVFYMYQFCISSFMVGWAIQCRRGEALSRDHVNRINYKGIFLIFDQIMDYLNTFSLSSEHPLHKNLLTTYLLLPWPPLEMYDLDSLNKPPFVMDQIEV